MAFIYHTIVVPDGVSGGPPMQEMFEGFDKCSDLHFMSLYYITVCDLTNPYQED